MIPPNWSNVWICPTPKGHLQATGRDVKGRKQYRYHNLYRTAREETKYEKMTLFGELLQQIRQRILQDLSLRGLPKEKVLATVVRLMDLAHVRVGNEEYARENQSYGLTTMRDKHIEIEGSTIRFKFKGKSGKLHHLEVNDRRLATIVARCQYQRMFNDQALTEMISQLIPLGPCEAWVVGLAMDGPNGRFPHRRGSLGGSLDACTR